MARTAGKNRSDISNAWKWHKKGYAMYYENLDDEASDKVALAMLVHAVPFILATFYGTHTGPKRKRLSFPKKSHRNL